ncbi:MAG: hypothetical protein WA866_12355, partial [Pseudolabrys sp.]
PSLFGPPLLLVGEDAAEYDELHAGIRATLNPIDTVYEMFVADVVYLEWEILRLRRQKSSLMRGYQIKALEKFLTEELKLPQQLAEACARNRRGANDRLEKILNGENLSIEDVLDPARFPKAEELAKKYGRREPDVVKLVDEILAGASVGIDELMAEELVERLDTIEHIDRLAAIAENRRNTMLGEIDRRRTVLGEALRRSIKEVEDAEFQVVEPTSAKRKTAA